jgi:hypothetical protein
LQWLIDGTSRRPSFNYWGRDISRWNAGSTPAKLLVIFSPPGFEQYFAEVVGDEEIDTVTFIESGMAVAHKYHLDIVGLPRGQAGRQSPSEKLHSPGTKFLVCIEPQVYAGSPADEA